MNQIIIRDKIIRIDMSADDIFDMIAKEKWLRNINNYFKKEVEKDNEVKDSFIVTYHYHIDGNVFDLIFARRMPHECYRVKSIKRKCNSEKKNEVSKVSCNNERKTVSVE